MPSLRSSAPTAPGSPPASAASAASTILSFSAAEYRRRVFVGTVSTEAPLAPRSRCWRAASGGLSRPGIGDDLGTSRTPFSARRDTHIQGRLSHATLAHRGSSKARSGKNQRPAATPPERTNLPKHGRLGSTTLTPIVAMWVRATGWASRAEHLGRIPRASDGSRFTRSSAERETDSTS